MNFSNYAAALALFASAVNVYVAATTELKADELFSVRKFCMKEIDKYKSRGVGWLTGFKIIIESKPLSGDEKFKIFFDCMKKMNSAYDDKIIKATFEPQEFNANVAEGIIKAANENSIANTGSNDVSSPAQSGVKATNDSDIAKGSSSIATNESDSLN